MILLCLWQFLTSMYSFDLLHWIYKPLLDTIFFLAAFVPLCIISTFLRSLLYQASACTRKPKKVPFENIIEVINCIQVTEDTNIENKCSDNILHVLSDKLFNMFVWVFTSLSLLLQFPSPKFHLLHIKTVADTGQRISVWGLRLFTRQRYHLGLLDCYSKHPLEIHASLFLSLLVSPSFCWTTSSLNVNWHDLRDEAYLFWSGSHILF